MRHPAFTDFRLDEYQSAISTLKRESIELRRLIQSPSRAQVGRSRIGGTPDVGDNFKWPYWSEKPLAFLCQINTNEINTVHGIPISTSDRLLLFFYSIESFWQTKAIDPLRHRVLIIDTSKSPLMPLEKSESDTTFLHEDVHLVAEDSLPFDPLEAFDDLSLDDGADVAYEEDWESDQQRRRESGEGRIHKFLGYPEPIHYDPETRWADISASEEGAQLGLSNAAKWRLLFQLDSLTVDKSPGLDSGKPFDWGDMGKLFFGIPASCWDGNRLNVDSIHRTQVDLHR